LHFTSLNSNSPKSCCGLGGEPAWEKVLAFQGHSVAEKIPAGPRRVRDDFVRDKDKWLQNECRLYNSNSHETSFVFTYLPRNTKQGRDILKKSGKREAGSAAGNSGCPKCRYEHHPGKPGHQYYRGLAVNGIPGSGPRFPHNKTLKKILRGVANRRKSPWWIKRRPAPVTARPKKNMGGEAIIHTHACKKKAGVPGVGMKKAKGEPPVSTLLSSGNYNRVIKPT